MKKKLNQFKAEFAKKIFKKADEGAISKEVALDLLSWKAMIILTDIQQSSI